MMDFSHFIWTTKDGRHIPVPEMTNSHLTNTIKMLMQKPQADTRTERARTIWLIILMFQLSKNLSDERADYDDEEAILAISDPWGNS